MKEYVCGFMFSRGGGHHVLLIKKTKPARLAGLLNAVGGKIEPGETPRVAMRREFLEETGVDHAEWAHVATLNGGGRTIYFFRADSDDIYSAHQTTEEPLLIVPSNDLPRNVTLNLPVMLPLCRFATPETELRLPIELADSLVADAA